MLGLGSNLTKVNRLVLSPVTDSLVLKHDYQLRPVRPLSDGAAYFVASNTDSISLGVGTALTPEITGFTACFWAKTNDASTNAMVLACDNGTHQRMYIGLKDGSYDFGIGNTTWSGASTSATTDWTHVALTYTTGDVAQLYINGVKDYVDNDNDANAFTDGTFGGNFYLGQHGSSTSYPWDGYICNVGLWNTTLTQTEIKSIMWKDYSQLTSDEITNLTAWWNLSVDASDSFGDYPGTLA